MSKNETSQKVAEFLLQIKAIKLQPATPFQWASGWHSPIYCDNRKILSYPKVRNFIRDSLVSNIKTYYPDAEVIAGVATGAIAQGVLVAQELDLPFVYVRASSKGHGLQNLIEGDLKKGQKVVVLEDLISTGMSSLKAVEALRSSEADVLGMTAIFTYGFGIAIDNFKENKCTLHTLSNYNDLITTAVEKNYVNKTDITSLEEWRKNPSEWNK